MLKILFIGSNLIGLLLFNFFVQESLSVEQNLPSVLIPGESKEITVTINKADIEGFAKYQLTVSNGLNISVVDGAGASFTFNDHTAKFIWMSLPDSRTFTFKYRISSNAAAVGIQTVDSRFSYIYENERVNYDLPQAKITVSGAPEKEVSEEEPLSLDSMFVGLNEDAIASVNRKITPLGDNKYRVDVTITKLNMTGFAKVEEIIPDGYTAINVNGRSAVFSVDDNRLKYIWFDIPNDEILTVSYQLISVLEDNTEPELEGKFSFPKGSLTEVINIGGMHIPQIKTMDMEELAANEILTDSLETDEIDEKIEDTAFAEEVKTISRDKTITLTPDIQEIEKADSITDENIAGINEDIDTTTKTNAEVVDNTQTKVLSKGRADGNISNVPEPEEGISYRVQVAAGKNNLNIEQFSKMYYFGESLKLENHKGWFKYTTGYYELYKDARDDRQRITKQYEKFKGPFVTAYNDGDRITVQEALMVTKQKWYP